MNTAMSRRVLVPLLLVLGLGLALAPPAAQAQKPDKIKITCIPIAESLPLWTAIHKKFLDAERIELELTKMGGGAVIFPALTSGSIDLGCGNLISFVFAKDKGFPFQIVVPGSFFNTKPPYGNAIMVRADGEIKTPQDLIGKRLGINTFGGLAEFYVRHALTKAGVDPNKVQLTEVPFPQMPPLLLNKQVDGAYTPEPFLTLLQDGGKAKILLSPDAEGEGGAVGIIVADEKWIAAHRDLVTRFVRAYRKGIAYTNEHQKEARTEILPKFTALTPEMATKIAISTFKPQITQRELQLAVNLVKERLTNKTPDTSKWVLNVD